MGEEWTELLGAEEREGRGQLPHTETLAETGSKIMSAFTNGNLTKAMTQLTSFGVAPMTEATVQTSGKAKDVAGWAAEYLCTVLGHRDL